MQRSERIIPLLYSQDARRILYLALLGSIAAFAHAFSVQPSHHSTSIGARRHQPTVSIRQSQHSSQTSLFMAPRRSEPDGDEWKALLAAFQMYKAAYGDLKVPSRFIVPGMPPWPENAWGMKLGQRVAAIRSTGKYVQNNEERRKKLDDMGFVWRLRAAESAIDVPFDQIYLALQTFIQESGKGAVVPPNFVVPDCDPWPESTRGLPLGKKLATVRTKAFLKNNPGAKEKLEGLGIQLDGKAAANDTRFQKVYDALVTYNKLNGDLLVPQPFVVPDQSDEWPESTWGLRLGARVNAIRSQGTFVNTNPDRRKQLDDIGFVWSPPPSATGRRRGRKRKDELEAERAAAEAMMSRQAKSKKDQASSAMENLFGPSFAGEETSFESNNFSEGEAPKWSFDGSAEIEAARAAEEAAKQPQDEYQPPVNLNDTLEAAKQKAIDVGVIVVDDDGVMRKGKREKNIPWFNDDFGQEFVFEDVLEALTVYKSMYGDFSGLVENDEFVVPASGGGSLFPDDDDEDAFVFDVDASARAAAAIATFEKEGRKQESEDLIAAEIQRLQQETESPTMETETRVVTQTKISSVEWPEHLAGMGLGNIVRRIRDGSLEVKHLPERKAQLDAIDFDWGEPKYFIDVPFEKAMCGMFAYYLVRGDMFVYEDFVMPDEDPWPRALAGYEIGKVVRRIRELQNSFEAYHTEKVALLRAIDFVWFPTVALPLDPNEQEMSSEMLMVSALGHPDYAKMIDIPMGLPDKIIADGPFFESDDPKLWWKKWHNWDYVKDYWYAQGRRDNAFVLRENGYPTLAEEHEAKYGPGMFQQIEELMQELNEGIEDKNKEEKDAYIEQLNFFREEMTGCRDIHPKKRKTLLEELDTTMLALMTDGKLETVTEETLEQFQEIHEEQDEFDAVVEEEIDVDPADYGAAVDDIDDYEEEAVVEEDLEEEDDDDDFEFDIEDELGLDDDEDEEEDDDGEIVSEVDEDELVELEGDEDGAFE